jgi:LysR family transcriptional activator of nhaA
MNWLNYHHLLYFWTVAREGGLVPAGRKLRLSHSTLSAQIRRLEEHLGERLFERRGRRLHPTEVGERVLVIADEIFSLGRELVDSLKRGDALRPRRLEVGVVDAVPKSIVRRLLEPAVLLEPPVRMACREGRYEELLGALAAHALDVVIADAPLPSGIAVRAYEHLLGRSGVWWFAVPALARRYRRGFPASLADAPVLLPMESLPARRAIDAWLAAKALRPRIVGEFQDSALLKAFGSSGLGLFPAPEAVATDIEQQFGVARVGRVDGVEERFYAISIERRFAHPAAVAISRGARSLFKHRA